MIPKLIVHIVISAILCLNQHLMAETPKKQDSGAGLTTTLIVEESSVRLGDPVIVSLQVFNGTREDIAVDVNYTLYDEYDVLDPDGEAAPYVGHWGQTVSRLTSVKPSTTTMVLQHFRLSDTYLFLKTGRYQIKYRGRHTIPRSNQTSVDIAPGAVHAFDALMARLYSIRPEGWHLSRAAREFREVAPFGHAKSSGWTALFLRDYMRGEIVYLWFLPAQPPADPSSKPRLASQYLGTGDGLHIYAAVDYAVSATWPRAAQTISTAAHSAAVKAAERSRGANRE